jgi:hypothetical protein
MRSVRSAQRGTGKQAPGVRHARRRAGLAAAGLFSVSCLLALAAAGDHSAAATLRGYGGSTKSSVRVANEESGFRIAGVVGGLYPGDTATLVLTVSNAEPFAIVVTSISTAVAAPSAGCKAAYLTVAAWTGALAVPGRAKAQVTVPVTLAHAAPDACQGMVFPLLYSGTARKA